ncbi:MAG: hypothetical protein GF411_17830 [Candidatus Lokiarchaeota archaeon]|nr:hypothetical protein [Candidatus Lokiarchaeota archaeon]
MSRPISVCTIAVLTLLVSLSWAAASPFGIDYTLDATGLDVRNGSFGLFLMGSQSPHYRFYDIVENTTDYHVLFVRMFEYTDTNSDGGYTHDSDVVVGSVIALQSGTWTFSNFVTQEESGEVVQLDFELASSPGSFGPQQPSLQIVLVNHIEVSKNASLKFDVILSGWNWHNTNNSLAVGIVISIGQHSSGQLNRPTVATGAGNVSFDNGYLSYPSTAEVSSQTVGVTASVNGANPQNNGEQIYFCFPYFNETLTYDPTIGLIEISSITTTPTSPTPTSPPSLFDSTRILAVGVGVTIIIAIVVKTQSNND